MEDNQRIYHARIDGDGSGVTDFRACSIDDALGEEPCTVCGEPLSRTGAAHEHPVDICDGCEQGTPEAVRLCPAGEEVLDEDKSDVAGELFDLSTREEMLDELEARLVRGEDANPLEIYVATRGAARVALERWPRVVAEASMDDENRCLKCGGMVEKMRENDTMWRCTACGKMGDRIAYSTGRPCGESLLCPGDGLSEEGLLPGACRGRGWCVMDADSTGVLEIQRCDSCMRFDSDNEAVHYVDALARQCRALGVDDVEELGAALEKAVFVLWKVSDGNAEAKRVIAADVIDDILRVLKVRRIGREWTDVRTSVESYPI